jgi:hypothetical protein
MPTEPVIEARGLTRRYGDRIAVDNADGRAARDLARVTH